MVWLILGENSRKQLQKLHSSVWQPQRRSVAKNGPRRRGLEVKTDTSGGVLDPRKVFEVLGGQIGCYPTILFKSAKLGF